MIQSFHFTLHVLYKYSPFLCRAAALKPYLSAARWIPLGINPYANLTAVFFSGMEQDPEDEDTRQSSEMYVYAC
jgi:hypothetical protein